MDDIPVAQEQRNGTVHVFITAEGPLQILQPIETVRHGHEGVDALGRCFRVGANDTTDQQQFVDNVLVDRHVTIEAGQLSLLFAVVVVVKGAIIIWGCDSRILLLWQGGSGWVLTAAPSDRKAG